MLDVEWGPVASDWQLLAAMVGSGQRVSALRDDWVELTYAHEGAAWWQRHQVASRHVFTAQAPHGMAGAMRATLAVILESLVLEKPVRGRTPG